MAEVAIAKRVLGLSTLVSFKYRNFRFLWLGSLTEHTAEWVNMTGISWLLKKLTNDPFVLGLYGFWRGIPMLLFPFFGGILADRVERKRQLAATLAFGALLGTLLALLVAYHWVQVWQLFFIAFLAGVQTAFNHPARNGLLPNTIAKEDLNNAVALDRISVQGSRIFAGPLAGWVIGLFVGFTGVAVAFGISTSLYLVATTSALLIFGIRPPARARQSSVAQNFREGFRYVRANPRVFSLILLGGVPLILGWSYQYLLPFFAEDVLKGGAYTFGWLIGASGVGALVAMLFMASLPGNLNRGRLQFASGFVMGIALLAFAFSTWLPLSLLLVAISSGTSILFNSLNHTNLQLLIPDEYRGRVLSFGEMMWGLATFFTLGSGAMARWTGAPLTVATLSGLMLLAMVVAYFKLPWIRKREEAPWGQVAS